MNHEDQTQPQSADTGERISTLSGAMSEAIKQRAAGRHETEHGAEQHVELAEAERIIENWPETQKKVARQLIDYYGPPNEATPTKLLWYRNGPWKRTMVTSDVLVHDFPAPHIDFVTQTIDYKVAPELFDEIGRYDGSCLVDRTAGEVAARCDSEAANVVTLNLMHEIVSGKRTVEEARQVYAENIVGYTLGREAPYAERLLFEVPESGTEDTDETTIAGPALEQMAGKVADTLGSP